VRNCCHGDVGPFFEWQKRDAAFEIVSLDVTGYRSWFCRRARGYHSDAKATMYVSRRYEQYSSATRDFTSQYTPADLAAREVPTVTLDDLLPRAGVTKIDFLSMDIELSEPKALAAFDLRRYAPRLVCIEAHPETRQHILDYFTARGYTVVGKYLRLDTINLWFTPLSAP
jgi:FkbM family methyltransferase